MEEVSAAERRSQIAQMVLENGRVLVADLVHQFEVTETSIRRDLTLLEQANLAHKGYTLHGLRQAEETLSRLRQEEAATDSRLQTLLELGIDYGQGFLLGRPGPMPDWQSASGLRWPGRRSRSCRARGTRAPGRRS